MVAEKSSDQKLDLYPHRIRQHGRLKEAFAHMRYVPKSKYVGLTQLSSHPAYMYSVGPPSARQRNAIQMAFRWRADDGPF